MSRSSYEARGQSIELRACPRSAKVAGRRVGRRTPFTAGFRVDGWLCPKIKVDVEGRTKPLFRRIGFGKRPRCGRPIAAPPA